MSSTEFVYPSDTDCAANDDLARVCGYLDIVQDQLLTLHVKHEKLLDLCQSMVCCEIVWDEDTVPQKFDADNEAHCAQVVGTQHIAYARLKALRAALNECKLDLKTNN